MHVLLRRISMLLLLRRMAVLLLLLLRMALLARIKIGRITTLIRILRMPHVHGRGHGIPVALIHESRIAARSSHGHAVHGAAVVLLARVAAVWIGTAHLGVLLLLLLLGIVANTPATAGRHLSLWGPRHLTLVRGRRLGGSRALIGRTHFSNLEEE